MKNNFLLIILAFCAIFFTLKKANAQQVVINEVLASNATVNNNNLQGEYEDWIELYNPTNASVNISGWYITDNKNDTAKWQFPNGTVLGAYSFVLLWADGLDTLLHTNFKLSSAGEEVALYNAQKELVDFTAFVEQRPDISWGRHTDANSQWGYFTTPTPHITNNLQVAYKDFVLYEPIFRLQGGFFNTPQTVEIFNVSGAGTVRYTTDGSAPTFTSAIYTQPLSIQTTTVVRARVFIDSLIPGPIITNTYFLNENFEARQLPVLSLSTNPDYFWDPQIGIYVQNYKPEWEYPVHLEFYEPTGLLGFHHDAGVKLDGENSWELPQKLLSIYSRKQYGASEILYQLFPNDHRRQHFENIILRCSGNDWSNTMFRDGMEQSLTDLNTTLDRQDFRACAVYINGQYLGIHNIRTRQDEQYFFENYGVTADSIDVIENDGQVKSGDSIAYQQVINLLTQGVSVDSNFAKLDKMIDVQNYTDYIQAEMFCSNQSWGHNIALWRKRTPESKFKWSLLDFDRGFFVNNANSVKMSFFTATNGADWSNPAWATLFLRKMLQNNNYKKQFVSRYADNLFTTFNPQQVEKQINTFSKNIENEIPYHVERWLGTTSNYGDAMPSVEYWYNEVKQLKDYANLRPQNLYNDLKNYFSLQNTTPLTVSINQKDAGQTFINQSLIPLFPTTCSGQYFANMEFKLIAKPQPGFEFVEWQTVSQPQPDTLFGLNSTWQYYDLLQEPDANWNTNDYNDQSWQTNIAQFGYGDNDENTVLDYGNDQNNKTITYYFRKNIDIQNPENITQPLTFNLIADDGAVVYINGTEALRFNMPSGVVTPTTLAIDALGTDAENSLNAFQIPANLLINGTNTIAVEIHQADATSSDISFDAQLLVTYSVQNPPVFYASTDTITVSLTENQPAHFRAAFQAQNPCSILPDTILQNTILTKNCSPYLANTTVVVPKNVLLTIQEGVQILFAQNADLAVKGNIKAQGTQNEPIIFTKNAQVGAERWGGILLQQPTDTCFFKNVQIKYAQGGLNTHFYRGAIAAYNAIVIAQNIHIDSVFTNPIFARQSNTTLQKSYIHLTETGDGINLKKGMGLVENCIFEGHNKVDADGIDYDGINNGIVRNCIVRNFKGDNNDGLDIGENCNNLLIENNLIYNCVDKGISVGQESSATVQNNTIVNCALGMGLKDLSPVYINHNTFYNTQTSIAAYEKNAGYKGGKGTVQNCIFSNAANHAFSADSTAEMNIIYTLSDTDTLDNQNNNNNITDNPLFLNPVNMLFDLQAESPCTQAANDGGNIGTKYLISAPNADIMISEILYYETDTTLKKEFIELYNPNIFQVDISGYMLSQAIEFTFPANTYIPANEYVIVAQNADNYTVNCPKFTWTKGRLANEGEKIVLTDSYGILRDWVQYGVKTPWVDSSQVKNKSIELIAYNIDNHFAQNWQISLAEYGTPGTPADTTTFVAPATTPNNPQILLYPNPATNNLTIKTETLPNNQNYTLQVFDIMGKKIHQQVIQNNQTTINTSNWISGIYNFCIQNFSNLHSSPYTTKVMVIH